MHTPDESALVGALESAGCRLVGHRDRVHGSPELWRELEKRYDGQGPLNAVVMVLPTPGGDQYVVVVRDDLEPGARALALGEAHARVTAATQRVSDPVEWLDERGLRLAPVFGPAADPR